MASYTTMASYVVHITFRHLYVYRERDIEKERQRERKRDRYMQTHIAMCSKHTIYDVLVNMLFWLRLLEDGPCKIAVLKEPNILFRERLRLHTYTYAHLYTYTYIYMHDINYIHTHIRTYVRTYMHTYTHTYIHT